MKSHSSFRLTRRQFLSRTAVAAFAAPMVVPGRVLGLNGAVAPSNRIVFGGIGMGNRARYTLPNFLSNTDIQYVAVSDARADRLASSKELVDQHYGTKDCRTYGDFRDLLAQPDIDAVSIATGNRWHAMASMFAAHAGKDVYCEKPISRHATTFHRLQSVLPRYGAARQNRPGAHSRIPSLDWRHRTASSSRARAGRLELR